MGLKVCHRANNAVGSQTLLLLEVFNGCFYVFIKYITQGDGRTCIDQGLPDFFDHWAFVIYLE
jgi:hypothetical protein